MEWTSRTSLLLGEENLNILRQSHVMVAGLGGVGSMLAEALCRAGIGKLTLVDGDTIQPSNLNRQLLALNSNEGQLKADVMALRLRDINPGIELDIHAEFLAGERIEELLSIPYSYVADAIDTLAPKLLFIRTCISHGHLLVSSMGTGGKLDPSMVRISQVEDSYGCRLAYIVRKKLHRMGIRNGFKVVFSPETVPEGAMVPVEEQNKKSRVGTISYMPPIFGCFMASVIIRGLLDANKSTPTL